MKMTAIIKSIGAPFTFLGATATAELLSGETFKFGVVNEEVYKLDAATVREGDEICVEITAVPKPL